MYLVSKIFQLLPIMRVILSLSLTLVFAQIFLILESNRALGASVVSTSSLLKESNTEGCRLLLPLNRLFAPIVTDETTQQELVPVQDKRDLGRFWHVYITNGRRIKVNCGRGNPLNIHETFHYLRLTCVRGSEFLDDEDEVILLPEGIECSYARKPTPIIYKNGTCSSKGTNFDVEFVTENPPRKFYSSCLDESTSITLYSTSYIDGKSIANGEVEGSGSRPNFRGHEFYPFNIREAYKWENAFEHLTDLLGSVDLVNKYFPTQQYRFSRGHLFPNGDAIKRFEKHATFYYINTVPQWQILNGGNWAIVEQDVRDLAANLEKRLEVVTGSFGVTTLPDDNNNDIPIWLARDNKGILRLPVPRYVWKIAHDPAASAAVAIVQVNNPWVFRDDTDILCNDICDSLGWLRSSGFHSVRKGYTFCCDVNDLRRTIPYVPRIDYKSLLGVGYVANNGDDDIGNSSEDDEENSYSYDDSSSNYSYDDENYGIKDSNTSRIHNIAELFANMHIGSEES